MRRRARFAVAAGAIIAGTAAVFLLNAMSSAASGPFSAALARAGAAVSSAENLVRRQIRGPGRAAQLSWFAEMRADVARLRQPDIVLLGAYESAIPATLDGVVALEERLGVTLPLIQVYVAWGDAPEHQFPTILANAIWDIGSVPVITWEPWLTEFTSARHPHLPLRDARDKHGLAAVARGDYDFYIDSWAQEAVRFGRPFYVRFGHEMNDPYRYPWGPQNNTKEEFIAAWRRVVTRFRAAGATNAIWVWSPHVAYQYWDLYYPGPGTVDWVATGALNFGPIAQWSRWWSFDEIFGARYDSLASFGKPIMIAEFGSLAVGGDRQQWYTDALGRLPESHPAVKALLFFEVSGDQTVTYQKVDWRLDSATARSVAASIAPWAPPRRKTP